MCSTFDLSTKCCDGDLSSIEIIEDKPSMNNQSPLPSRSMARHKSSREVVRQGSIELETSSIIAKIPNTHVSSTLDDALIFSEDVLIALQDPSILQTDSKERFPYVRRTSLDGNELKSILATLCPRASVNELETLLSLFSPETYRCGNTIWEQGDISTSLKILVEGTLSSLEDEEGATESIVPGSVIGELGLVNSTNRFTTVKVVSDKANLYSLSKEKWESLTQEQPGVARHIDMLVIKFLAHRVQHISVSKKRSLPV